jgi:hypothetical protein
MCCVTVGPSWHWQHLLWSCASWMCPHRPNCISAVLHTDVILCLQENFCQMCCDKWQNGDWLGQLDSAPTCRTMPAQRFMVKNNMAVVPHPPCSPDLALITFSFFQRWNWSIKGRDLITFWSCSKIPSRYLILLWRKSLRCFQWWQNH